jgi:hypothetical protein
VKFRVPIPAPTGEGAATGSDSGGITATADESEPEASEPDVARPGASTTDDQIEFLCPNGHRLHGPTSLQGKPGQCPDCGSKFRVPRYDEISEEEEVQHDISVGRADGAGSDLAMPSGTEQARSPADMIDGADYDLEIDAGPETAPFEQPAAASEDGPHDWVRLLSRLWTQKTAGVVVELCLQDGETIVPERFARGLSQKSHGVFAVKNSNGTYTVTAVPWTSVNRLLVRGIKSLPEELFG